MKTLIILGIIALASTETDYYVLEDLDMNKLVDNIDDLKEFTDCLLEKIPCNKVYDGYREHSLEAVHTMCKRCRPHVKHMFWQYLQALKTKLPNEYVEYRYKYDPHNKSFDTLEIEMDKYSLE